MKKTILILAVIIGATLTSCDVNTSGNIDINPSDVQYFKDGRTGLCFGVVASRKAGEASATGLGLTCVPCEEVEKLLD